MVGDGARSGLSRSRSVNYLRGLSPRGLRIRLLVLVLGFSLLLLACSAYVLLGQVRGERISLLRSGAQTQAQALSLAAAPLLAPPDAAALTEMAAQAGSPGVGVAVLDLQGGVYAPAVPPLGIDATAPEMVAARAGQSGWDLRQDPVTRLPTLYVAAPVRRGATVVGAVWLVRSLVEVERAQADDLRALISAGALVSLLAASLALWFGGRLARDLEALRAAANEVAEGAYGSGLALSGPDEVVLLGQAFGRMAWRLRASFASLGAERDRVEAVLRHMADGILIVNAETVVTLVNPAAARALGLEAAASVGQRLAAVVREHEIVDLARRCLATQGPPRDFIAIVERASPRRYLRAVGTRLGEGHEAQALLVVQNLTELRRLETMRRDFLANVSHELRTPIAATKAMVETLENGAIDDPPAARDFLARMHREVDGLAQLVEELLQLSRIEAGQASLERRPVDPQALMARALDRLEPLAERAGVTLSLGECPSDMPVMADAERAGQILVNLVHNAIKFTGPGGRVELSARQDGDELELVVSDTGVGIAADDLPRVFERFYKADKSRASGGTGLGLAIVKHLVQAHGGRTWAESAGPGRGSVFKFTLPLATAEDSLAVTPLPNSAAGPQ